MGANSATAADMAWAFGESWFYSLCVTSGCAAAPVHLSALDDAHSGDRVLVPVCRSAARSTASEAPVDHLLGAHRAQRRSTSTRFELFPRFANPSAFGRCCRLPSARLNQIFRS